MAEGSEAPKPSQPESTRRTFLKGAAAALCQEELGFRAGLHRTYIGSIERGEQNISVDNIHKLARALKIRVEKFFK
jgi:transcriptional regulator with XRE-family HTH domain